MERNENTWPKLRKINTCFSELHCLTKIFGKKNENCTTTLWILQTFRGCRSCGKSFIPSQNIDDVISKFSRINPLCTIQYIMILDWWFSQWTQSFYFSISRLLVFWCFVSRCFNFWFHNFSIHISLLALFKIFRFFDYFRVINVFFIYTWGRHALVMQANFSIIITFKQNIGNIDS